MNYSRKGLDGGLAHTHGGSCIPDLGGSVSFRSHTSYQLCITEDKRWHQIKNKTKKRPLVPVHLLIKLAMLQPPPGRGWMLWQGQSMSGWGRTLASLSPKGSKSNMKKGPIFCELSCHLAFPSCSFQRGACLTGWSTASLTRWMFAFNLTNTWAEGVGNILGRYPLVISGNHFPRVASICRTFNSTDNPHLSLTICLYSIAPGWSRFMSYHWLMTPKFLMTTLNTEGNWFLS